MKQFALLLILLLAVSEAWAKTPESVTQLFNAITRQDSKTTETLISGDALDGTGLDIYHSIVITDRPDKAKIIAERVKSCGNNAVGREIKYIDDQIFYAQYVLQPEKNSKINHYIFYINTHIKGGDRVMVVYMSGQAKLEQIKKLINQQ